MNIIIIGGTKGIGKETALCFAKEKANQVLVTGRDKLALKELASGSVNGNISSLEADLTDFDKHADFFKEQVYSHFSRVDILINNAGLLIVKDFMSMTSHDARLIMETNFIGPASVIRLIKPIMATGSHIVNISSMGGFQGSSKYSGLSYYSASKAALACLSECLATEFAGAGISVNCLALGSVETEMFKSAFPGIKAPLQADEMAEFIRNFACTGNRFFNGKVLPVAVNNP